MKERVSATVEKETIQAIERILKKGRYRNKSHIIEDAVKLLEGKGGMIKINKKAQVTLFIIIGIIVVLGVLALVFLRDKIGIFGSSEISVQSYMAECMQKASQEISVKLSEHGGVENPQNYALDNKQAINYICYNKNYYYSCIMQYPMFISFETEQIKNYVEPRVEQCFQSLKVEMEKRGNQVNLGQNTNFSVELFPGKISLKALREVTINSNEETISYDKFEASLVDPVYKFAEIAQEISNQEAKYCYFEYLGYMVLYRGFEIEKKDVDGVLKIYTITNLDSKRQFKFAIRSCAMPAGM